MTSQSFAALSAASCGCNRVFLLVPVCALFFIIAPSYTLPEPNIPKIVLNLGWFLVTFLSYLMSFHPLTELYLYPRVTRSQPYRDRIVCGWLLDRTIATFYGITNINICSQTLCMGRIYPCFPIMYISDYVYMYISNSNYFPCFPQFPIPSTRIFDVILCHSQFLAAENSI